MKSFVLAVLLAAGPLLISGAEALEVPPAPSTYVADYAGVLGPAAERELNAELAQYERATSNQIVVALFPSLEGEPLEDFSLNLARSWGIGTSKNDNGILFTAFLKDRAMRIEVGYGLEGAVTDAVSGMIIRNEIAPYFRAGDYDGGVRAGVRALAQAAAGEYTGTGRAQGDLSQQEITVGDILLGVFFLLGFGYLAVRHPWIFLLLLAGGRGGVTYGGRGGGFRGGGFSGGGGSFGGGGASGGW